jgi:hypothetical protein
MMAAKRFFMCEPFAMFDHAFDAMVRSSTAYVVLVAEQQLLITYRLCAAIHRTFLIAVPPLDVAGATNHFVFPTSFFSQSTVNTDHILG